MCSYEIYLENDARAANGFASALSTRYSALLTQYST